MTDLDTLLDEATPRTIDVTVCLDGELHNQRERLITEGAAADEDGRLGRKSRIVEVAEELRALEERIGDRLLRIRITQMPGSAWTALKLKHPVTSTPAAYDRANGYNTEAVARQALMTHGKRVVLSKDADGNQQESVEDVTPGQWVKIFEKASGGDVHRLIVSTLGVNQLEGMQVVQMLSKGSRRTSSSDQK